MTIWTTGYPIGSNTFTSNATNANVIYTTGGSEGCDPSGVREPREPKPTAPAGAMALEVA